MSNPKCPDSGKAMFRQRKDAKTFMRRFALKGKPYKCSHCDHYHFTTRYLGAAAYQHNSARINKAAKAG